MEEVESNSKAKKNNILRQVYDFTMKQCEKPSADIFLAVFSFFEAIIIPIPTDPFLLARATAKPKKALHITTIVVVTSVLGAAAGYYIGMTMWESIGPFFYKHVIHEETFRIVQKRFSDSAFLFTFLGGFTPLPFKVFAVTAGTMKLSFAPFILGAIIGRGMRFYTIGALVYYYGETIKTFIEERLEKFFWGTAVVVVLLVSLKYAI